MNTLIECLGCQICFDGRQVSIEHTEFACSVVGAQTILLHLWYYAAGNFQQVSGILDEQFFILDEVEAVHFKHC